MLRDWPLRGCKGYGNESKKKERWMSCEEMLKKIGRYRYNFLPEARLNGRRYMGVV